MKVVWLRGRGGVRRGLRYGSVGSMVALGVGLHAQAAHAQLIQQLFPLMCRVIPPT
ncbi:hypothetical protein RI056_01405 [Komagataeibacter nataicola]|uniref:hypothetical protein n=1 Tax=Komagataeibacter nataicola TaxID=265960 RepID=UPI0028A9FFF9|nr:hypothetical protein [Komagataeibacter nataicola]WNM08812.1 hypothetical protein RI056_01405 [Komagataeibacter nataicola]